MSVWGIGWKGTKRNDVGTSWGILSLPELSLKEADHVVYLRGACKFRKKYTTEVIVIRLIIQEMLQTSFWC